MVVSVPLPPAENDDPWFVKRDAFDRAVRERLNGDLSPDELSATIAEAVPFHPAGILPGAAADLIASRLAFGSGDITVGVASDSTSDGPTDWVRLWLAHVAPRFPRLRIENNQWVNATGAYGPTTVVQAGEGEPAFSGDVLHDTFTRTSNLSTPDSGGPWEITTPNAFTLTGAALVANAVGRLRLPVGVRDMTTNLTIDLDATGTGANQNHYFYHGWTYGSLVQIAVNAGGLATAYIYRRVNNTTELIHTQRLDLALGVPVNADAGILTVTIDTAIQNHTLTLGYGGRSWTHSWTITEVAYAAMEAEMSIFPQSATPGMPITEVTVAVADRPATWQTLRVWSGTMGGGTMQYQMDNWDAMFGDDTSGRPLDVMILAHGHNYGSMGPVEYIGKVEGFLAFMRARRADTRLLLASENPQFAPSANPPAHAARLRALREWAQQNGLSYAPVFEHFASQPDGGRSWVLPDGVHPTAPPTPLPAPGYGMSEWGKVLAAVVTL